MKKMKVETIEGRGMNEERRKRKIWGGVCVKVLRNA
jgi:hypothetical protein